MSTPFSINDLYETERIQDEPEKPQRRPVMMVVFVVLLILLLGGVGGAAGLIAQTDDQAELPAPADGGPPKRRPLQGPVENAAAQPTGRPAEPTDEIILEATYEATVPPTRTPAPTPAPVITQTPTVEPTATTIAETGGVCQQNGGIQWQGDICTCAGVVDRVTLCADGSKSDVITDTACTPNPADCPAPGGSGNSDPGQSGGSGGFTPWWGSGEPPTPEPCPEWLCPVVP